MKKNKKINTTKEQIELFLGKGTLFLIELTICFALMIFAIWFVGFLCNVLLNNTWLLVLLIVFDFVIIFYELITNYEKKF